MVRMSALFVLVCVVSASAAFGQLTGIKDSIRRQIDNAQQNQQQQAHTRELEVNELRQIHEQGWSPNLFEGLLRNSTHLKELHRDHSLYGEYLDDQAVVDPKKGVHLLVEKDGGEVLAGAPFVANARVVAVLEGETRGPKIRVFKKKRRKGMRRTKGHRAVFTRVKVKDILL